MLGIGEYTALFPNMTYIEWLKTMLALCGVTFIVGSIWAWAKE